MILTLITVGKLLEAHSKGKTTDALKGLMNLAPKTATLIRNGAEVTVPIDQVQKEDLFVVRPGGDHSRGWGGGGRHQCRQRICTDRGEHPSR